MLPGTFLCSLFVFFFLLPDSIRPRSAHFRSPYSVMVSGKVGRSSSFGRPLLRYLCSVCARTQGLCVRVFRSLMPVVRVWVLSALETKCARRWRSTQRCVCCCFVLGPLTVRGETAVYLISLFFRPARGHRSRCVPSGETSTRDAVVWLHGPVLRKLPQGYSDAIRAASCLTCSSSR